MSRIFATLFIAVALSVVATQSNAALSCVAVDYDEATGTQTSETVTWFVGQPVPSINEAYDFACAANGNELDYVKSKFSGLPLRVTNQARTMIWHGDDARFIIDNL